MHTYREITNELLESLVNDVENTVEKNSPWHVTRKEVRETRDEILLILVHKIKLKYLNKYTQD